MKHFAWITTVVLLSVCGIGCQDDFHCKPVEFLEGSEGKISCLPRNKVPFQTKWARGITPIVDGTEFRIENDGLVILKVNRGHEGTYRVTWTDPDWGSTSSKDATVKILAPARFLDSTYQVDAREGENVTLDLKTEGIPKPSCRWYNPRSEPVLDTERISVHNCSLYIANIQPSENGMYTCIATNKVNPVTLSAVLSVDGRSGIDQVPETLTELKVEGVTDTTITLHAEAPSTGQPISSIHCIYHLLAPRRLPDERSGSWLLGPGIKSVTVNDLRAGFRYRLHCASRGVDGLTSRWSPAIDVNLLPPAPEIWLQVLSQEYLRFEWDISMDITILDDNSVEEYQLSYWKVSRQGSKWIESSTGNCPVVITLQSCSGRNWEIPRPGNAYYRAKVRARNAAGWSEWSQEVTVGGATF